MSIEKNFEYIGYETLARLNNAIHKAIHKVAAQFKNKANDFKFQQYKMKFGERDDDIYIATFPRSGTTMMQMILYQLTTSGSMDFKHIYDVSPWIRNESFRKQEPRELPSPRLIKTHDQYRKFPKETKGRFIVVHRDGRDVAKSYYNQQKDYNNQNLKFDLFLNRFLKSKSWFKFTKGWFKNKHNFPVLYIRYEDLLSDKRKEILRIIEFCQLNVQEEAIERALHYSSFEFMKANEKLFGDQPAASHKVFDQFIRSGTIGEGEKNFNEKQKKQFDKNYQRMLAKKEKAIFNH